MAEGAVVTDLDLPPTRCNGSDGYLAFVDQFLGIRKQRTPRWKTSTTSFTLRSPRSSWRIGSENALHRHRPAWSPAIVGIEKQERQPGHGHRLPGARLCASMEFVGRWRLQADHETCIHRLQSAASTLTRSSNVSTSVSSLEPLAAGLAARPCHRPVHHPPRCLLKNDCSIRLEVRDEG